ncbi:MAG: YihY/virulence factor BrkB family protein [Myxococcota bacterium]
MAGLGEVLWRVKNEIEQDRVTSVAAGVAFHIVLSLFPFLIALVSLYGLIADPGDVRGQLQSLLGGIVPASAIQLLGEQLAGVASRSAWTLLGGMFLGFLAAAWCASTGVHVMMQGIQVAFDETNAPSFVRQRGRALLLTVGLVVLSVAAVVALAVVPVVVERMARGTLEARALFWGRWPLLALLCAAILGGVHRLAPARGATERHWMSWGVVFATASWLGVSALASVLVGRFAGHQGTYGALGVFIVVMLWIYLSALVTLTGGELDAELDARRAMDSPVGAEVGEGLADPLVEPRAH